MKPLRRKRLFLRCVAQALPVFLFAPLSACTAEEFASSGRSSHVSRHDTAAPDSCDTARVAIASCLPPLRLGAGCSPPANHNAFLVGGLLALEDPVQKGRDALGSGWQYPWYDAKTDDVRRVKVRGTWELPDWNPRFGSFRMNWIQFLFWTLIALVLGTLAYFLIRAYLRREDRRALSTADEGDVRAVDDAERIASLPFQVDKKGLDLLEQARRHYQAGRYSQAIVYLFSHQLVELDKRQFIRLARGKTNRQYVREVASAAPIRDLLQQTMVAFEDVFFGNHALDRPRFETCWNRVDEFDRLTARAPS